MAPLSSRLGAIDRTQRLAIIFAIGAAYVVASSDDSSNDSKDCDDKDCTERDDVPLWIWNGGWVLLVIAVLEMFYSLAVVVEEYFVPALNIMCVTYNIPDDVAGATFMAAGASSPEMFASFISLFVTHSALGVGTIIGSEIFNHLIISAGSIFYSKSGTIQCEPRLVGREAGFYAFALAMLLYALNTTSENDDQCKSFLTAEQLDKSDDANKNGWICVPWYKSLLLVCGYFLYAAVCSFYVKLMARFCPIASPFSAEEQWDKTTGEAADENEQQNVRASTSMLSQPEGNFKGPKDHKAWAERQSMAVEGPNAVPGASSQSNPMASNPAAWGATMEIDISRGPDPPKEGMQGGRGRSSTMAAVALKAHETSSKASTIVLKNLAPAYLVQGATADLYEVEMDEQLSSYSCYLWKNSKYYSKIPHHSKAWQLRWVVIDKDGFRTHRSRTGTGTHKGVKAMNIYQATTVEIVDSERFILKLVTPTGNTLLQAPSEDIMIHAQRALLKYITVYKASPDADRKALRRASVKDPTVFSKNTAADAAPPAAAAEVGKEGNDMDDEDMEGLLDWPESKLGVFFHVMLLPVKASMYYTIPDVRIPGNEHRFFAAMGMSVFWLAFFSFIMTECMENIGPLVGIDDFIMGVVFAAAGTSFPNVFASMVVARQGLGNAAISNALGGNVFNIFLGLGLPWLCYSFLGSDLTYRKGGHYVYTGLAAGGIVFPVLVLLMLLVGFIALLIGNGWKLVIPHAYLAIFLYVGFLAWTFTTSLQTPSLG